jgi:CRP/FNR family transcriptional regulator, anaerobic regulatory protein
MFEQIKSYYKETIPQMREEDWIALESKLSIQHLKKGQFLTRQGEISRTVSFINKGLVRLYYISDGREICTGFIAENEYISAYASFLTQSPSAENIEALEETEMINLSYDDMQALYKSNPVFETFGRKIAEMLFIFISTQTANLLVLSPEERYQFLVDYQPFIIQRVPQYMIASFIGITPEHLSRLRKKKSSNMV